MADEGEEEKVERLERIGMDDKKGEQSNSALAASSGGRQDGCGGHNTRPNMVNGTRRWPTFSAPKRG